MYRITINNSAYKCAPCSMKNWEAGTRNDYMLAINGRTFTEKNLREVKWLLDLFRGNSFNHDEWTPENSEKVGKHGNYNGMSDRFYEWLHKKAHFVKYLDRLCGFERTQYLSGYGFCQGYFDKDEYLAELKEKGVVKIPFSALYDIRQSAHKMMKGCFMEIRKY